MSDWIVGVDLGGTKIALGLVTPQNRIVARHQMPTNADDGPQAVVERIAQSVVQLDRELPAGQQIAALGICSPGPVDHETGTLIDPPNLVGLHHTPLQQMLAEHLNMPICLEHDAKAAALGDFYYGAGRKAESMVYVVVGTGVGAAIIVDGQLYRGERNFAGEVGHITLDLHGEECHCGSRGCAETYLSGPRLALRYQRALKQAGEGRKLKELQPVTGELVTRLAGQGDSLAARIVAEAGQALGAAVAAMAMLLNIDLYVIGGSVSKSGDLLLEPARQAVPQYSFRSVSSQVRIVTSELDDDGPILGCARLARQAANR